MRSKALALSVERWLLDVAISDPAVVRGIVERRYSLRDAYVAHKEGRLAELKESVSDRPLKEVIAQVEKQVSDRRLLRGLEMLAELAPPQARLSWLLQPQHITDMLTRAARTQKVNSVHRSLYAAIKRLLSYEVGNARKRAITADVVFRHEDDTRDVLLTPEQVQALLHACDHQLRPIVAFAVLTGVDQTPILRITRAHVDFQTGVVRVDDRKNRARGRSLQLSAAALNILRTQSASRKPDEPIFGGTAPSIQKRFRAARAAAGLPHLRFKDLRHVFSAAWVVSGGTLKELGVALGHTKASTTLRYTGKQPLEQRGRMDATAKQLGLTRSTLKIHKGA